MESDRSKKKSRLGAGGDLEIRKHRARPAVIHFQSDSFFEVCPILDSNRDLEVYRDVSYSEVVMRTILPFIFAAWIDADGLMRPGRKRLYVAGATCTGCQSKGGARGEPKESPARGMEVAGAGTDASP